MMSSMLNDAVGASGVNRITRCLVRPLLPPLLQLTRHAALCACGARASLCVRVR